MDTSRTWCSYVSFHNNSQYNCWTVIWTVHWTKLGNISFYDTKCEAFVMTVNHSGVLEEHFQGLIFKKLSMLNHNSEKMTFLFHKSEVTMIADWLRAGLLPPALNLSLSLPLHRAEIDLILLYSLSYNTYFWYSWMMSCHICVWKTYWGSKCKSHQRRISQEYEVVYMMIIIIYLFCQAGFPLPINI